MKPRNLPEKVILAAPAGLGFRDSNLQALFHMFATVSRVMGMGFLLVGSVIERTEEMAPSEVFAAGAWEHLCQLTAALPSQGVNPQLSRSNSNLLGHVWYFYTRRLEFKFGLPRGSLDPYTKIDLSQWGKPSDASELGIMGSELFKKAKAVMELSTDEEYTYAAQCFKLSEDGLLSGENQNILRNPPGVYPEPPFKTNPLERPSKEKANAALNKFRDSALRVYEDMRSQASTNSYKQWIEKMRSTPISEMDLQGENFGDVTGFPLE